MREKMDRHSQKSRLPSQIATIGNGCFDHPNEQSIESDSIKGAEQSSVASSLMLQISPMLQTTAPTNITNAHTFDTGFLHACRSRFAQLHLLLLIPLRPHAFTQLESRRISIAAMNEAIECHPNRAAGQVLSRPGHIWRERRVSSQRLRACEALNSVCGSLLIVLHTTSMRLTRGPRRAC